MTKRAKRGGEIGTNGEFYEGGKFLPSTRLPKRGSSARASANRSVLVAPGELAIVPEGRFAIFHAIREYVTVANGKLVRKFHEEHPASAYQGAEWNAWLDRMIEQWNAGVLHLPTSELC